MFNTGFAQDPWEITHGNVNYFGQSDISFVNSNVGFAIGYTNSIVRLMKTTNKGLNWSLVMPFESDYYWSKNSSICFKSETVGYVSYGDKIVKYYNGATTIVLTFPTKSSWHRIRFVNDSIGYAVFNRIPDGEPYQTDVSIYKTTDGGDIWFLTNARNILTQYGLDKYSQLRDIDFSSADANNVHAVGYSVNGTLGTSLHVYTSDGYNSKTVSGDAVSGSKFGHVSVSQNEVRILGKDGLTIYNTGDNTYTTRYNFGNTTIIPELALNFINNDRGYACLQTGKIMKTTNGGYNWTFEVNCAPATDVYSSSTLICIGDIVYYADATTKNFFTKKLSINFNTFYDNQSTSSSINFDGTNYPSPSTQYLRGGNSIVFSSLPNIIDPNQNSEKLFYKWSNGNMNYNDENFYFDMSGTEIANYYKSRSLSTTSIAINNSGQVKSWRDTACAINRIYESIGGIFFSKSYDNGTNFKREEVVNFSASSLDGNNNSNPSIFEARDNSWSNSNPVTHWDRNKNMVACWERFNATSGETEIKLSARNYDSLLIPDTTFYWNRWTEGSEDRFTHFTSPSSFRSFPKIFAVSMGFTNLGYPHDNYFMIVPHLRPASNGSKIEVSCRFNYIHADFQIDSGEISDLSVINYPNSYLSVPLHFVYRKGIKIIYYKAQFNADGTMAITKTLEEGPLEVSSGDGGFPSRFTPDISLMNNVPVITYAASYDAWRTIEYEDHTTGSIRVNRYPIVKVQKLLRVGPNL